MLGRSDRWRLKWWRRGLVRVMRTRKERRGGWQAKAATAVRVEVRRWKEGATVAGATMVGRAAVREAAKRLACA